MDRNEILRNFRISMSEIAQRMGTLEVRIKFKKQCLIVLKTLSTLFFTLFFKGIQVRGEAFITDFFYNNTQRGWCETRIINKTLDLR
jgi:hypothetical protein